MSAVPGPVLLVVDDDAAVRSSLKFALELEGLEVRVYESGAQVLADRDLGAANCLVVDQCMPGMSGIELVEALRGRNLDIPTILITARPSGKLRSSAGGIGIRWVLEKPLAGDALLDCIRRAVGSARGPRGPEANGPLRKTP
ncbi:MAG TPA: response regulator [Thermohalobaculum sp.]|nr:response regulator [Thermohalobaculum sp.]